MHVDVSDIHVVISGKYMVIRARWYTCDIHLELSGYMWWYLAYMWEYLVLFTTLCHMAAIFSNQTFSDCIHIGLVIWIPDWPADVYHIYTILQC